MITIKRIDTIDGIKDLIFEQTYNDAIDRTRSSYFYRGMPDASYKLVTSLSRNCKGSYSELEQPLLDNFIKYVRIEDPTINESVFDTTEMLPWIRTFISRITKMNFSNRTAENKFKADVQEMYRMYGLDGGNDHDI